MLICFSVWTYFNSYYYHIFYKRKSLFLYYESFPSLILLLLHSLHCVFHFLAHPWCLSYLSFFLCQSKSSVSLPYSHSLLLGIVFFSPCFLPWSQLSLLFSLSALLPLFSPVFLRIFFPSLPIPTVLTQLSQQHALEQSRCQILTAIVQKMTPRQWPDFVVPPSHASTTFSAMQPLFVFLCTLASLPSPAFPLLPKCAWLKWLQH